MLAVDEVRYHGEPVAVVAADDLAAAQRAAKAVVVDYEILDPVTDVRAALFDPLCPQVHPGGNLVRHQPVRRGRPDDADVRALADVTVTREYQVGMQDQAFLGPEAGLAVPAGGRRCRAPRGDPVAARGPRPDRPLPRPGPGPGAHDAGRRRRRVRRPRGPVHADPRRDARTAHRASGEDGLQPPGVLLRARPPASRRDALHARCEAGRKTGLRHRRDPARRGRLRLHHGGGRGQRRLARRRPLRGRAPRRRRLRRLHEQPALRCDARFRRGPGVLRLRVPDGRGRRRTGHGSAGVPGPQRGEAGLGDRHRTGDRGRRAAGRDVRRAARDALAAGAVRRRSAAGRIRQHDPRRGGAPRCRLRRRHQEHLLLGGIRRLLDGQGDPEHCERGAGRAGAHRRRRGGPGPGHLAGTDRPDRTRGRARHRRPARHHGRFRRIVLRLAPVLYDRWSGESRLRSRSGAGLRPRPRAGLPGRPRVAAGRREDRLGVRRAPRRSRPGAGRRAPSRRPGSTGTGRPACSTR